MRQILIQPVPATTLYKLAYEGGGEIPDELKGHFTSQAEANRALKVFRSKAKSEAPSDKK